jgi:hypothetical protein
MDYEILRYRPQFLPEIAVLQRHLWGHSDAVNAAYFEWKHVRNPFVSEPWVYVARHAGQLVGMRAFWGMRWQVGESGQEVFIPAAADTVIVPEHRDRGLFAQLTAAALADLAQAGHAYVINLSASPVTMLSSLASGWRAAGALQLLARRSAPRRLVRAVRGVLRHYVPRLDRRLVDAAQSHRQPSDPFQVFDAAPRVHGDVELSAQPRPDEMAAVAAHDPAGRIRAVRNAQILSWRFSNPLTRYRFVFHGGAQLNGYLLLRAWRETACIVDWRAANETVQAKLLRAAIEAGQFVRMSIWGATLPEQTRAILHDHGFASETKYGVREAGDVLLVRATRDGTSPADWKVAGLPLASLSSWRIDMIDSDAH